MAELGDLAEKLLRELKEGRVDPEEIARMLFPGCETEEELARTLKHAKEALIREGCGEITPATRAKFFREKGGDR